MLMRVLLLPNFEDCFSESLLSILFIKGQISMKPPNMVHINLASNPQYLPHVRDALQNSAFNVNPRIEGTSIFIQTPRVTHEHREKLSKAAKVGRPVYCSVQNISNVFHCWYWMCLLQLFKLFIHFSFYIYPEDKFLCLCEHLADNTLLTYYI